MRFGKRGSVLWKWFWIVTVILVGCLSLYYGIRWLTDIDRITGFRGSELVLLLAQ